MNNGELTPDVHEGAIDSLGDFFFVVLNDGTFVDWNEQFETTTGYSEDEIADLMPTAIVSETERGTVEDALDTVFEGSGSTRFSTVLETKGGDRIPYEFQWALLDSEEGPDSPVVCLGREIDDGDDQGDQQRQMYADTRRVSVPIVEVWDGILLSTVIGKLSSEQAETFTEALLERISDTQASVAIIDITGGGGVDTQTAQHLIDTIQAVKLMGGQTIITGLNPEISQTLVKLGIGFDVETRSSLQDGLETALELQGVSIN